MTAPGRLLRLADEDNILVVTSQVEAGEVVVVGGEAVPVSQRVELGHKVAARTIAAGAVVIRYGMPIGSATRLIAAGEWVHTHNLASNYMRTLDQRGADSD